MEQAEYGKKIGIIYKYVEATTPKLPYHNVEHAKDVSDACIRYGIMECVDRKKLLILAIAGLVHDLIYHLDRTDNEEKSAEYSQEFLEVLKLPQEDINDITRLILAAKPPTNPKDILEKIICDADLDNLGREDFMDKGERVRIEIGIKNGKKWYERQLSFLKNHQYYTESARVLRQKGKEKNIRILEGIIGGT